MQQSPNLKNQVSGNRYQEAGVRRQVAGFRFEVEGLRLKVTGFRFEVESLRLKVQTSMFKQITLGFIILLFFSSCSTTKNSNYFEGIKKDTTLNNLVSKDFDPKIRKGDLLGITVASLSPDNTVIYNAPQSAQGTAAGYLVDENGNIHFFKLDTLHVEGMTRSQLKETLEKDLVPFLAQTVVAVSFLNRHVTLIGALSQVVPMPADNMTIFDALSSAGGISDKGMKDSVMVIRENGNAKEFKRLNLTDQSIFYSPYFYMQPNDIIYIKPVKTKVNHTAQIISYVTAGISFVFLIIDRILK